MRRTVSARLELAIGDPAEIALQIAAAGGERVDEHLESIRSLERDVARAGEEVAACAAPAAPTLTHTVANGDVYARLNTRPDK